MARNDKTFLDLYKHLLTLEFENQWKELCENKDINAIAGVAMILGLVFIFVNIIIDIIVAWLDPKVRLMGGNS